MNAGVSRYFLLVFAALVVGVAFVQVKTKRRAQPALFIGGSEAPILSNLVLPAETVAVVPADQIGRGTVVDIEDHGGFTYVLHAQQWLRVGKGEMQGPFGLGAVGAPGVFDNATDIIPTDTMIYVLQRLPARIMAFHPDGRYATTIRVRSGDSASSYIHPERFSESNNRFHILVAHFDPSGTVNRELVTGRDEWKRIYWLPSDSLLHMSDDVILDTRGDSITLLTMLGYRFHSILNENVRVVQRSDPPRYSVPDSIRWDFERTFAGAPAGLRDRLTLPEYIPPARAFSLLDGGYLAVAVSREMEAVSIEVLDVDATPLWRSSEIFDAPVFLQGNQLFRVEEQPNHLVVLRHRIKGAVEWPR